MKWMRSHILRIFIVSAIWTGMIFCIAQPLKTASSSRAFVHWLSSFLSDTESDTVRRHITDLNETDKDFAQLIAKASKIIRDHNEEFDFPFETGDSSTDQLLQMLVLGWNHFQDGNNMGKAVSHRSIKTVFATAIEKATSPILSVIQNDEYRSCQFSVLEIAHQAGVAHYILTPMASGIAIGAP